MALGRLALAVPACLALAAAASVSGETIAIVGGTLIDGTGRRPIADAVVVVDGQRITAAGRRKEVAVPPGARVVDATDKFVIPGLMDANVHLVLGSSIEFIVRHEGRYEELIEEAAQVALKNGLTTVFDSWGPLQPLLDVRERLRRGEVPGARIFVAGNIVGFSGPWGRDFNAAAETTASKAAVRRINEIWTENVGADLLWMTPDGVRQEVRRYIARGIDFLKYGASTHNNIYLEFSPETQRAIVEECRRAGIVCQTHTTNVMSLRHAIEVGNDMLQHCDVTGPVAIPDATLELMAEKGIPCAILPRTRERLRIELMQAAADRPGPQLLDVMHFNAIRLVQAGVPLLLSTDAGLQDPDAAEQVKPEQAKERSTLLGEGHFLWFKAMQENGMAPMDALLAATRNIAAAYRKLDDLGTLERGKLADLLILDADPLDDLNNVRKIHMVMQAGAVVERERLPVRKVLTAPRPKPVRVLLETELGEIELEVDAGRAPITAGNFLKYVEGGYYDGGSFGRTVRQDNQPANPVKIEVVQASANAATLKEKKGLPPIPIERTRDTGLLHRDGTISMARAGPDTATHSFFICIGDQLELDFGGRRNPDGQGFAAFGRLVRGGDVVRKILSAPAEGQALRPSITIASATRLEDSPVSIRD